MWGWGGVLYFLLCCLSEVEVVAWDIRHCSNIKGGAWSWQLDCIEQIQKKGAVSQPVSFALKDFWIFPLPPMLIFFVLRSLRGIIKVAREGNHSYIFLPTAFSLFYYKWALWRKWSGGKNNSADLKHPEQNFSCCRVWSLWLLLRALMDLLARIKQLEWRLLLVEGWV